MIAYKPEQRRRIRPEVGDSGCGDQALAFVLRRYGWGQSDGEEGKEVASSKEEKVEKKKKKKKLDPKEVSLNSKDFVKSHMFFLDLILPIIKECPSPTTSSEATLILHGLIFKYEQLIATKMLEAEPYKTIYAKMNEVRAETNDFSHLKNDDSGDIFGLTGIITSIDLEEGKFGHNAKEAMPRIMAVYKECLEFFKNDIETVELIKKHFNSFCVLGHQVDIAEFYRHEKIKDFKTALGYILRLAFAEGMKLADLYNANMIIDYMASMKGKSDIEQKNEYLDKYYDKAVAEADKLWSKGDERTHGKMAEYLCKLFNKELRKKAKEKFNKEFPNRRTEKKEKVQYTYAIEHRLPHHLMSLKTLKERLKETAIKYGKYRNNRGRGKKE